MSYRDYYDDMLSGNLKSIYAFYGVEKFIMNSMIDIAKKNLITEGLEAIDLIDIDAKGLTYVEAKKMVEHLPFGSEKRVVILRNPDFIDSEKWQRENLDNFLEIHRSAEHILTLLICDKLDNRKYGVKALNKVGKVVEFTRINRDELIRWIKNKFNELKRPIAREALTYIADNSLYLEKGNDSDLGKLYSFIQVLSDSVKHSEITLNDVREQLDLRVETNIFKWRTALLAGKSKEAIYYLDALLADGEAPIKLMYMLEIHLKDLYLYSLLKSAKLKEAEIAKKMGKQVFMLKDLQGLMNARTYRHLGSLMELLLEYDDMMKIGGVDGKLVLQMLAFKIAEVTK